MQSALLEEWVADFVEEAEEKGKEEKAIEIAAKLLNKGHPPDYVAEIVDFPIDKVNEIAKSPKE